MSRRRQRPDDVTRLAADVGGEDVSDPKEFHAKPWDGKLPLVHLLTIRYPVT